MNGEEAAALEGGEGSDEEDTTFKKMLRSKIKVHQGSNLALANLLNARSFLQKASTNHHHLLFLASENKSLLYQLSHWSM